MSRHHWYIVSKSRIVPIVIRVVDWNGIIWLFLTL
uniref:Uncharacterized protein n=1 Tax=Anguilla anguilla TaxID=7936 RepID=A0A0E9UZN4_ANGAN